MSSKTTALDVAICHGCGKEYTRSEIAQQMWAAPYRIFMCSCGFEYHDAACLRPLTIREMIAGKASGRSNWIDVTVIVSAVARHVEKWGE